MTKTGFASKTEVGLVVHLLICISIDDEDASVGDGMATVQKNSVVTEAGLDSPSDRWTSDSVEKRRICDSIRKNS